MATRRLPTSQIALLVAYSSETNRARVSQLALVVAIRESPPIISRSLAWTYTFDGHTFYVLNLANEGTYVYDTVTGQWSNFQTQGYGTTWNFMFGNQWGQRVVGADAVDPALYELAPSAVFDEGWRDIVHTVTGILASRNRVGIRVDAARISGSIGYIDDTAGALLTMRFSDDNGTTWSPNYSVNLYEAKTKYEIAYRSLGMFRSPGRLFQFTDVGGLIRIDGADVFLNSFDEANTAPTQRAAMGPQSGPQRGSQQS